MSLTFEKLLHAARLMRAADKITPDQMTAKIQSVDLQWRFPRSKRLRIRRKWAKAPKNCRTLHFIINVPIDKLIPKYEIKFSPSCKIYK